MHKIIKWLAVISFGAIACFIFFLVVTGRGETNPPTSIGAYAVKGADISAHNGDVDFNLLAREGIEFVFLKATEGVGFKDAMFHRNYRRAADAGLKIGAYHFFRFDSSGYLQALNVMHSLRGKKIELPVVIDVEEWTNPSDRHTDAIVAQVQEMARVLRSNGYNVMIYTNKDGYSRFVRGRLEDIPLWLCSFSDIDKDVNWNFWQYSHRGIIRGVDRMVDLNVFGGTRAEWDSFVAGDTLLISGQ